MWDEVGQILAISTGSNRAFQKALKFASRGKWGAKMGMCVEGGGHGGGEPRSVARQPAAWTCLWRSRRGRMRQGLLPPLSCAWLTCLTLELCVRSPQTPASIRSIQTPGPHSHPPGRPGVAFVFTSTSELTEFSTERTPAQGETLQLFVPPAGILYELFNEL